VCEQLAYGCCVTVEQPGIKLTVASTTPTCYATIPHQTQVCKVHISGQSNLTKKVATPPHMDGPIVYAGWCQCAPQSNTCFLRPTRVHAPNDISIGSANFAQLMAAHSLPLKIAPSYSGSGPPSNTWFLGPTRIRNPNGISIGSAIIAGLVTVTGRQTTLLGL